MLKKNFVYHPFVLAIYPILALYFHNYAEVAFTQTLLPLVVSLLVTTILVFFLGEFFKDEHKAGIITSLIVVLFFYYAPLVDPIKLQHRYIILILFTLIAVFCLFLKRLKANFLDVSKILNVTTGVLLILVLGSGIIGLTRNLIQKKYFKNTIPFQTKLINVSQKNKLDVYYIILDGYANPQTLKSVFHYDNKEFMSFLQQKGFYIAWDSHCNYPQTKLSLASSLQLNYLPNNLKNADQVYELVRTSAVKDIFRQMGYKIISLKSIFTQVMNSNQRGDIEINTGLDEFLMVLLRQTMLMPFDEKIFGSHVKRGVDDAFKKVTELQSIPGPRFVFAYSFAPHPPYSFDENGNPLKNIDMRLIGDKLWSMEKEYLGELKYVNKQVMYTINYLQKKYNNNVIIIIQSDHGTAQLLDTQGWTDPSRAAVRERMLIFNAYYFPDKNYKRLYKGISPVNTFRVIFNQFFGQNFKLLPDKAFFIPYETEFKFIDLSKYF